MTPPSDPQANPHLIQRLRGEGWQRWIGHAGFLLVVALGVLAARFQLLSSSAEGEDLQPAAAAQLPAASALLAPFPGLAKPAARIERLGQVHTMIPSRPRFEVIRYAVQPGDSLFGIAAQFGLKPETLFWGNFETLQDSVHNLQPGQELNILPVDGTFYEWSPGDSLLGVAEFFKVDVQAILDWPGNGLPQNLDLQNPDIEPGSGLVIPGGSREVVDWRGPRISRANPASARILGPGYCGAIYDGPVGGAAFVWPTPSFRISGYTFDAVVHPGVDLGGAEGNAIFASEAGVVVYAGWHNGGYGNVIVIDHGDGWQTLYAHLSVVNVGCGFGVGRGDVIGAMGSTGNSTGSHLHFEMLSEQFGKVNPLNFLP
jgi:murein DD-endopeptidase MepM/ murein hydrolase activator NlpD